MDNINEVLKALKKYFEKNNYDIVMINNNPESLKDLMSLSTDSLYKKLSIKPGMKLYKYCPFNKYTIENIKSGNVYLSNPLDFDDTFDSLSDAEEYSYINIRLQFYLQIFKVNYDYNATNDELENLLFAKMGEVANTADKFDEYLSKININLISKQKFKIVYLKVLLSQNSIEHPIRNALLDEYNDFINTASNYRISCFTTNPCNLKMWSLYANKNKGVCIEYTVDDKADKYIFSVMYSHVRGDVNTCIVYEDVNTEDAFLRILLNSVLRKDICWAEQNEYRYITANEQYPDNLVQFYPITGIYMGNKILKRNYKVITNICKELKVDCYYMQRNLINYELVPKKIND